MIRQLFKSTKYAMSSMATRCTSIRPSTASTVRYMSTINATSNINNTTNTSKLTHTETITQCKVLCQEALTSLSTIRDYLRFMTTRLTKSNVEFGHGPQDAYEEAIFIISHSMRISPQLLEPMLDSNITMTEKQEIINLLLDRITLRIPVAYLANTAVLQQRTFYVDKRVIIPRSYISEILVNNQMENYLSQPMDQVKHVLDCCTGSGCLAILAAETFNHAQIDAVDVSHDALLVAKRNVEEYDLQEKVHLIKSDMFTALQDQGKSRQYDVIISNPPYVKSSDMKKLPAEYLHEPSLALEAGQDGMNFVRIILQQAYKHLKPDGILMVEVGGLRADIEAAFPSLPFTWVTTSEGDNMVFMLRKQDFESTPVESVIGDMTQDVSKRILSQQQSGKQQRSQTAFADALKFMK